MTVNDWLRAVARANPPRIRHRWVEDATSLPTHPVYRCEKCGAMRIGFKGRWRWRGEVYKQAAWEESITVGRGSRGQLWSRRCPPCKTRDA